MRAVGVVGLGRLGLAIARRLLEAGYDVGGFDISAQRCAQAAELGVRVRPNPGEVAASAGASLVLVGGDDEVLDVCVRGADALITGMAVGHTIVVSDTVRPQTVEEVARAAQQRGCDVLDVPLVRGEQAVEQGDALALVGGGTETYERCRPVVESFASATVRVGDVGAGQVAKMVNNLLLWSTIAANYEGLDLARRFGVDLDLLRQALLLGSGGNWALHTWDAPRDMPWAAKDMEILLDSCGDKSVPAPVSHVVQEAIASIRADKLAWQDGTGLDTVSMAAYLERSPR